MKFYCYICERRSCNGFCPECGQNYNPKIADQQRAKNAEIDAVRDAGPNKCKHTHHSNDCPKNKKNRKNKHSECTCGQTQAIKKDTYNPDCRICAM